MTVLTKQISSLEKIGYGELQELRAVNNKILMRGERFSYQLAVSADTNVDFKIELISPLAEGIKLYAVRSAVLDYVKFDFADDDYITTKTGAMPDILSPIENNMFRVANEIGAIWVTVRVPKDTPKGEYDVTLKLTSVNTETPVELTETLKLDVIDVEFPEQSTTFTQWFHVDCIANVHGAEIYSERHWELIDKYMALASDMGITMLLTPVITPPLDTAVGGLRPCTQLVEIEKKGNEYTFNYDLLKRWIALCKKNNIKYFEISHLFSQWGLKYSPNIWVTENGERVRKFGWHVDGNSAEYADFLKQFIPSLIAFLKQEGIKEKCFFHLSDEPHKEHLDNYKYANELVQPMLDGCLIMDAISDYDFFEYGLMDRAVTATDFLNPFFEHNVQHQWAYYCCAQSVGVGNRFLAQASYRNRILGLQIYKFNIEGFLHWGYNFYNNQFSREAVNPYVTTSSDKGFPSGDAFSVYPTINGVIPSLRAVVFKEALDDVEICKTLERYIGREAVVKMIDDFAGMNLTFSEYPRNNNYIPELIEQMQALIKKHSEQV